MTDLSVTLPQELLAALRAEARRRHTSVSAVAREALQDHFGWARHGAHCQTRATRDAPRARMLSPEHP